MSNPQQHPAVQAKRDIRDFIQSDRMKEQLALALPKYLTPDKMARVALTAIIRAPKLMLCTQESLLESMMILAQIGLPPDGRLAHLIPYGDKCTVIIDWKGYVELARRNGVIVTSQLVCTNDVFLVEQDDGTGKSSVTHRIDYTKPRGEIYSVYSRAKLPSGEIDYEIMTKDEVEYVRVTFSRAKDADAWKKSWGEMARKTVIRRHSKRWPLDAEVAQALEVENDELRDVTPPTAPLFQPLPNQTDAPQVATSDSPPEPPPPPPKTIDEEMLDLCVEANVEESKVIQYLIEAGFVNETMRSFKEIASVEPGKLEKIKRQWTDLLKRIREMEDTLL